MIIRQTIVPLLLTLLLGAALIVPVLLAAPTANAAEAPSTDTEKATGTETSSSDTPPPEGDTTSTRPVSGSKARRANDKGGVFLPSEDISEDIAVSFPVDI